ncbi:MAG: glycosyltransferase family 4 protein [Chloroflexi bacterium]|nr:glycosyltransferase family 4 protein [Chloroflexota bacterium]
MNKNSKPRVTLLHYTALPIIGGVENVIADHARLFLTAGYPVTIVTGRGGDDPQLKSTNVVVVPEIDSQYSDNLKIARVLLEEGKVLPEFASVQSRIQQQLIPVLHETDVFIAHNVLNYHFNLPLVVALHDLIDQQIAPRMIAWCHDISRYVNPSSGFEQRSGFPWDWLRIYRREVRYVAVSPRRQRMLAETLQCAPENIRVIPNGVAAEMLWGLDDLGRRIINDFELLDADLILLMPIRVTRAKNIEFGLRVTAALKSIGLEPRLLVTGPPDPHVPDTIQYFQELLDLRHELGLDGKMYFLHEKGFTLDISQVAGLYRICDVVLMPSHREGFGLPILEGGLMGKPVFASNVPVVEQVPANSVYLIAANESPDHVATRMYEWMRRTPEHRLRLSARKDFAWSRIFAREIEPLVTGS